MRLVFLFRVLPDHNRIAPLDGARLFGSEMHRDGHIRIFPRRQTTDLLQSARCFDGLLKSATVTACDVPQEPEDLQKV